MFVNQKGRSRRIMFTDIKKNLFRDKCHIAEQYNVHVHQLRKYPPSYRCVWIVLVLILGILQASYSGILYRPIERVQHEIVGVKEKQYVTVTGTVVECQKGQSYIFMKTDTKARLYVQMPYLSDDRAVDSKKELYPMWYPTGTRIEIQGEASLPDDARNPGGFDQAKWLLSKKTGVVVDADKITVLSRPTGIWKIVADLHQYIETSVYKGLSNKNADIAMALLTGAKHRLEDSFYAMTQSMGIAHIFAVSGLHVGVIGGVLLLLFQQLGWIRSPKIIMVLGFILGIYCMLAGLSASSVRAAIMILLSAVAVALYRPNNSVNFLALSAIVLLIDNPFLLWSAGFQLSFGVTLSLLLFVSPIQKKLHWISSTKLRITLAVALSAWIGSVPLSAWHFYTFSPAAPIYNLLLVPIVTITVPILLGVFCLTLLYPAGAKIFFLPAEILLTLLQEAVAWLCSLTPFVQWNIGQPSPIVLFVYGIWSVVLLHWLNNSPVKTKKDLNFIQRFRLILILFLLGLIILWTIPKAPNENELLYLDTGQGSCAIFRTKYGETVLFDTGAKTRELASVLAWYGVNKIDAVILSHSDTDHISGLAAVLRTVTIRHIYMEQMQMQRETITALLQEAVEKGVHCEAITETKRIGLKAHQILLEPFRDYTNTSNSTELTAILYYPMGAAAFPGDLAASAVRQFVEGQQYITIWTVPHHGSKYSGSEELYELLAAKGVSHAVISCGKENRYGHPHQEVLEWLNHYQIINYQTVKQGAILFFLP